MPRRVATERTAECHIKAKIGEDQIKNDIRHAVCQDLPAKYQQDGNFYCILHLPNLSKTEFTETFQNRIIEDHYDFRAIYFPNTVNFANRIFEKNVDFSHATFPKIADFFNATFNGLAYFSFAEFDKEAYFTKATFNNSSDFTGACFTDFIDFREANFNDYTSFLSANFSGDSYFQDADFKKNTGFSYAVFQETSQIYFDDAKFQERVEFNYAVFKGYVSFQGKLNNKIFISEKALLNLQNIKNTDAKKVSFHTVRLEPSWFINTDARKFVFTECYWYSNNKSLNTDVELQNIRDRDIETPNPLLTKTCQQLADNYEESKDFELASTFRQMANESKRKDYFWWYQPLTLHWWYWLTSFYSESWKWALTVLLGLWLIFTITYTQSDFNICPQSQPCMVRTLSFKEAMKQSFGAMFLQKSEYRKPLEVAETFTLFENILAPLQFALLALAIRRKFMR